MIYKVIKKKKNKQIPVDWKRKSKSYLVELQKFLDVASNIEDEELQQRVIIQMLRCDKMLSILSEKNFEEFYLIGYKEGKTE